jgi:signal transduction histidine kinase
MGVELEFATDLCAITASHIRSALATRGLLAAERQAAAGRLAVWLAHDVLKDLGWMRRLLRRLPERSRDGARFSRDVSMLLELSDEVVEAVQRVIAEADGRHSAEQPPFDDVIGIAVRRVEGVHGTKRISESIDPGLRGRPCSPHLARAVSNLLDNALHASPSGAIVHLQATADEDLVRITIDDRGPGIPRERLAQVFEPGVSERLGCGGSGLGLPLAREIAGSLGGRVWLEPGRTCGTRAIIEVPATLGVGV